MWLLPRVNTGPLPPPLPAASAWLGLWRLPGVDGGGETCAIMLALLALVATESQRGSGVRRAGGRRPRTGESGAAGGAQAAAGHGAADEPRTEDSLYILARMSSGGRG